MSYITKAEFAQRHGFSRPYVSELLRKGILKEESNGMLNAENAEYALSLREATSHQRRTPNEVQELYIRARLQNEIEKGKLLKLETAEKEQSLISADKVKDTLFRKGRAIREAFMNLPDRVASVLEMKDVRTIHITLTKEIRATGRRSSSRATS